ncbi:MAG: VWA domain-containing protein [Phycisphaeraceae bacterium]|nr:VWA domain-containing protein [Phycisphaeraceae bacterium]
MTPLGAPEHLSLLMLVPAILLLFFWAAWRRHTALRRMGDVSLVRRIVPAGLKRRRFASLILVSGAVVCLAVAMARPRGEPIEQETTASGKDIVFVIDVSRSMLAQDLVPNRLERTKLWIKDMLATLQGDRVALVAFAGSASVKCPLTLDRAFFLMQLEDLSPRSVPRGGSLIGDAIRKTVNEVFVEQSGRHKDILLFTDGEDQESFPIQAAEVAAARGIRIITIGIGSESDGAPIPSESDRGNPEFVTYGGQRVYSRLMPRLLADIASASAGGVFLSVGTGDLQLDRVYRDLSQSTRNEEIIADKTTTYEELFQIPLIAAFLLLLLEVLVRDR